MNLSSITLRIVSIGLVILSFSASAKTFGGATYSDHDPDCLEKAAKAFTGNNSVYHDFLSDAFAAGSGTFVSGRILNCKKGIGCDFENVFKALTNEGKENPTGGLQCDPDQQDECKKLKDKLVKEAASIYTKTCPNEKPNEPPAANQTPPKKTPDVVSRINDEDGGAAAQGTPMDRVPVPTPVNLPDSPAGR